MNTVKEEMFEQAVSFDGANPPPGSKYLGSLTKKNDTYHFWEGTRDEEEGEVILYNTEKGMKFANKMEKIKKTRGSRHRGNGLEHDIAQYISKNIVP